jgi:ABC-2 type transport system ATP-binding protein
MAVVIRTEGLTKAYGDDRGIIDLTLECGQGEIFGFLGPNGSGKTTTIRTLLDLLHPTAGSATIFGLDSRRQSRTIRARVGNLPGGFAYEKQLTGRELIQLFARLRGMSSLGRAPELAQRFDVDLDQPLKELSRGNVQKIALIQALFHSPELLILDEPTAGLDPLMQAEFVRLLEEERSRDVTVFLSSHDLGEVERICDRVAIIRRARLVAIEDVHEMHRRAMRRFAVRFDEPVKLEEFEALPGVQQLEVADGLLTFSVSGTADAAVKLLAKYTLTDIEITHPSLEELFMTYYGDDE